MDYSYNRGKETEEEESWKIRQDLINFFKVINKTLILRTCFRQEEPNNENVKSSLEVAMTTETDLKFVLTWT